MAGKVRIQFHYDQFANLRKEDAINEELGRRAQAIAQKANDLAGLEDGYQAVESGGKDRTRWVVIAVTEEARRMEATNGCLTRALEAGNA